MIYTEKRWCWLFRIDSLMLWCYISFKMRRYITRCHFEMNLFIMYTDLYNESIYMSSNHHLTQYIYQIYDMWNIVEFTYNCICYTICELSRKSNATLKLVKGWTRLIAYFITSYILESNKILTDVMKYYIYGLFEFCLKKNIVSWS